MLLLPVTPPAGLARGSIFFRYLLGTMDRRVKPGDNAAGRITLR
jgi:hypothetical protein